MHATAGHSLDFARIPHPAPVPGASRDQAIANPGFGTLFTDHMVSIDFDADRGWHSATLGPRQPLSLDPACAVLHYAQEIFEGMKAYKLADDTMALFRPEQNARRFNASADRLAMPHLPEEVFVEAVRRLVLADKAWFPPVEGGSIYLRPFMFASEAFLGVRPAKQYKFLVIASPAGNYFKSGVPAVSIWVSQDYTRAAPGGTGAAKCGGNYAASLVPHANAVAKGYDQVCFLDAAERKWIEELGGMNLFFAFDDGTLLTPELTGTILPGITREFDHPAGPRGRADSEGRPLQLWPVARRRGERTPARNLRLRYRRGGHPGRQGRQHRRRVHHRRRRPRPADRADPRKACRHPARRHRGPPRLGSPARLTTDLCRRAALPPDEVVR